jgi:hypothetical protein
MGDICKIKLALLQCAPALHLIPFKPHTLLLLGILGRVNKYTYNNYARKLNHTVQKIIFVSILLLFTNSATASSASVTDPKTRGLLNFIGSIEGPAGYDDYYRGVSTGPPRPLTSMTIREVLAWQDSIDAASPSEAAGRYQIMEDTLRGTVRANGINLDRRFDANTQDELAEILLKGRGWNPNRTDYIKMGNSIAHEWAALPMCSGIKKGRSAYDGLAGNHSLTTCEAYLEVLSNGADPSAVAWALEQSTVGTAGTGGTARVRNILNQFIREYKNTFYDVTDKLVVVATSLLFSLMLIEWVWTTAQQAARGAGLGEYISAVSFRIVLGSVFFFIINVGNYSDLVIRSADGLLDQSTSGASINVVDLFDSVLAMSFELFGLSTFGIAEKFAGIMVLFLGAIIIGLILMSYMEVYLAFGAAFVALGFGGFSGTRHIAINYMKRAVGRVFRLFTALFCGALLSVLLNAEFETAQGDPMLLVGIMTILVFVILKVPSAVEQAVVGTVSISVAETLGSAIKGTPRNLARLGGVPGVK